MSPQGRRLFDMHLGPVARHFAGVGDQEQIRHVEELIERYGTDWPCRWLRECGCEREAEWWQQWRGQDAVHETILGVMWNGDRDGRPWGHDGHQF